MTNIHTTHEPMACSPSTLLSENHTSFSTQKRVVKLSIQMHLPYRHSTFLENRLCPFIHTILQLVNDLFDARLYDFHCTSEARASVAVHCGVTTADLGAPRFEQCVFFGVEAEAFREVLTAGATAFPLQIWFYWWGGRRKGGEGEGVVATCTAALVAILKAGGGAVVTGGEDAVGGDEDGAYASLHAVGTQGGEVAESEEVRVPTRAKALVGGEVELGKVSVEGSEGGEVVEDREVDVAS